jgi:hypothetical protein
MLTCNPLIFGLQQNKTNKKPSNHWLKGVAAAYEYALNVLIMLLQAAYYATPPIPRGVKSVFSTGRSSGLSE